MFGEGGCRVGAAEGLGAGAGCFLDRFAITWLHHVWIQNVCFPPVFVRSQVFVVYLARTVLHSESVFIPSFWAEPGSCCVHGQAGGGV